MPSSTGGREARTGGRGLAAARATTRAYVWEHGGAPPVVVTTETGEGVQVPLVVGMMLRWGNHPAPVAADKSQSFTEAQQGEG